MAQGLQAWNGSGQMVADIGDYSMRYAGTVNFNATAGTTSWWVPFGGMRPNGWIAVQVGLYYRTYSCIPVPVQMVLPSDIFQQVMAQQRQ